MRGIVVLNIAANVELVGLLGYSHGATFLNTTLIHHRYELGVYISLVPHRTRDFE